MRSSNRRIFAVGDCAATIQLARVADREAQVAAANILAELNMGQELVMDSVAVPAILFNRGRPIKKALLRISVGRPTNGSD